MPPPVGYEVFEGTVQQLNEGGFKVGDKWFNYGDAWTGVRAVGGGRVKLRARGRFLVHLVPADQELPPEPPPRSYTRAGRSPEEERRGIRTACLQASVAWLVSRQREDDATLRRPTYQDVLALGDHFERWVYRTEEAKA